MSLVRFQAQNHPNQIAARGGPDESVDDRATLVQDFARFDEQLGPFTIDVAAADHNAKCARYFTAEQDGLAQSWAGERVWCNPPFSTISPWVQKAWNEHERTNGIAMLLPANRTDQLWWHQLVEPYRDRADSPLWVYFLPGRMRFLRRGQVSTMGDRPPFGCCLLTWGIHSVLDVSEPDLFDGEAI